MINSLHEHALKLSRQHRRTESELVGVLIEIERLKLHRTLGFSSLFTYTVSALGLSEPVAYALISVARKAKELGALNDAISLQKISVHRASRIVAVLTKENAKELIEFAATHTQRETDQEVARRSDRGNQRHESLKVPTEVLELLKKAQAVMASKSKRALKLDETLKFVLDDFLNRHEPVRKAERARQRGAKIIANDIASDVTRNTARNTARATPKISTENSVCTKSREKHRENPSAFNRRMPIAARTRHAVNVRDQAQCTFIDLAGHRCTNDRWLHTHHIISVSHGGSNEQDNLTTLCSFHHDLVHQLGFAIEGQVNWIKEPVKAYCH